MPIAPPPDGPHRRTGLALGRIGARMARHEHDMEPVTLLTIRPGPVLHVWRDGQEVATVALDHHAALTLLADLARALR